jgi:DNA-binding CsgD family transcriptional regulator
MVSRDSRERAEGEFLRLCHSGLRVGELQMGALRSLRRLMPVDAAFFATADPGTLLFTGALSEEPLQAATLLFLDNEFGGHDVNTFLSLATSGSPVASLDGATRHDRQSSARYREIMRPLGLGDELRAALRAGPDCWGYLCLHRAESELGFTDAEAELVERLAPHIAHALRQAVLLYGPAPPGAELRPGVLVLTDTSDVVAITPEAEHLLSLMAAPTAGARLPIAVRTVVLALQATRQESHVPRRPPSARVPLATGGWLNVHASWLRGSPGEDRITVVLQPAQARDTVPLLLSAHGLTRREAEVARLVLRGASTLEMVDAMRISRYTVQDHLTAVFDKVGVRSRRDLAGALLGQAAASPPSAVQSR